jgi:hypothetical protein
LENPDDCSKIHIMIDGQKQTSRRFYSIIQSIKFRGTQVSQHDMPAKRAIDGYQ